MSICKVDNCDGKVVAKGFCNRHICQIKRRGRILKRTMFDLNEIVVVNDKFCRVKLYDQKGNIKAETIIDVRDKEQVCRFKWHLSDKGYARRRTSEGKTELMHHFLIGKGEVDHRNRNRLDNRRINLRHVNSSINRINSKIPCTNKSGYRGVSWNRQIKKWTAQIYLNYKKIPIGSFDDKVKAAKAYDAKAIKVHGEFAQLNFK